MCVSHLDVGSHELVILPWTSDYGATTVGLDPSIPATFMIHVEPVSPSEYYEPLKLVIYGMPPHLFVQPFVVLRMFANLYQVRNVQYNNNDLTIHITTYAQRSVIPRVAHVGVRRQSVSGDAILHIWSVWIRVDPLPPGDQHEARRPLTGRCIHLQTELTILRVCYIVPF
jgi:hypothetical protein